MPLQFKINYFSITYKQLFFQNIAHFGKKVEVFLFYLVKRHLKDVLDRTVRRCFTAKNEGNGCKKKQKKRHDTFQSKVFSVPFL